MPQKFPLEWPVGYPRTQSPSRSAFKNPTLGKAVENILAEIGRMKKGDQYFRPSQDVIISSNVPLRNDGLPRADYFRSQISDKGVAVYFTIKDANVVLCCDKWDTVESNMHSIYLTIEALRAVERWGVSDFLNRSFTGFKALPPGPAPELWYSVLGFTSPPAWVDVRAHYKQMVKDLHPDSTGGSVERFHELQRAYEEAKCYYSV